MAGKEGPGRKLSMYGREGPVRKLSISGGLVPCSGRRTPAAAGEEEEDVPVTDLSMGGGWASPFLGRYVAAEKAKQEEAVTGTKSKAEEAKEAAAAAVSTQVGKAAAADATAEVAAGDVGEAAAPQIKWVEMPADYLKWLLAQKREDYRFRISDDYGEGNPEQQELMARVNAATEAGNDDFFEFQARVRDIFEEKGRVMVPEGFPGRNAFDMQDELDEEWEKARQELGLVDM